LSINGIFYIVGVVAFGVAFSEAFASFMIDKKISRVRVALKATLLAAAGLNPLYLAATAILLDAILIIVEYCMRKNNLASPKSWLISNLAALLSLATYFFIPDSLLTLYIVMALASFVILVEIYMFLCERNLEAKWQHKFYEAYAVQADDRLWNLAPENVSEKDEVDKDYKKPLDEKEDKLIFNSFAHD